FFKIRVDEFGIGYPPRAYTFFTWKGTKFTLNWVPFGGFVKIFGENGDENKDIPTEAPVTEVAPGRSFMQAPRIAQALVLVAGVSFNLIFAWILISIGFMIGLPTSTSTVSNGEVRDPKLVITTISPDSPAAQAVLKSGDVITGVTTKTDSLKDLTPEGVSEFIAKHGEQKITVAYARGEQIGVAEVTPASGIIEGRKAIGISMDMIGKLTLPIHKAFWEGAVTTAYLTKAIAVGLGTFVFDAVRGHSDLSQVTGPVGIVGLVGDASKLGFIYLLSFTAFISINLAVINLIPFPALDGGRLLFVIIESIKRSPIPAKATNVLNLIGFSLLLILMVIVTIQDVIRLF
ncbi:MAG TPA: RIP metalloprotease RseP, partial [Candidatus Nanoarchaeia archaeon]|nr:RIP metalloprotease RseP [Candidatus Nanoarchaeia archaeon]